MHFVRRPAFIGGSLVLILATGCAPTFQDARMLGPGRVDITPSVTGVGITDNGRSEYVGQVFGAYAQAGVHQRIDIGGGYARFEGDDFEGGAHAVALGAKFGIRPEQFAVSVPVGFLFGEDVPTSETWQIHPTAVFTMPLKEGVDFTPSVRWLIGFCDSCESLVGFNMGFGLRLRRALTIRPEAGILVNPRENGVVWSFGVGVSIRNR